MRKVIVIGCPGSGKSCFARALREATGLPLYYLDQLFWNADKTSVSKEVFMARLRAVLAREAWILDGDYVSSLELRLQACDTVFFLDYPLELCLAGVRARRGLPRPDLPWVEDAEDEEFFAYIRRYPQLRRPATLALLQVYPDKAVHTFRTREEARDFLARL